jgi:hypothetical protein
VTSRVVPADEGKLIDHRVDYGGIVVLSVGLIALLVALDDGIDLGWTNVRILGLFALAFVALSAFLVLERRAGAMALVPSDVLGNPAFLPACLAVLMMSAIFFAALLYCLSSWPRCSATPRRRRAPDSCR